MAEAQKTAEEQALDERLKSALWYSIGQAVDEETIRLGVNASPQFIGSLTEMVWCQIENAAIDMEAFAKHAGRKTVSADDVLMLARRNEGLESVLRGCLDEVEQKESGKAGGRSDGGGGKSRGATGLGAGKGRGRGNGKGQDGRR